MAILFAILLFSLLIFIHELGHFVAAKLFGVQVNEFSMFMGPAIVKWQRGETLYAIRTIPIGGYCAMEGEDVDTDNPRSFQKAAWWKRLIILAAGAAMNFLIGALIYGLLILPTQQVVAPQIRSFDDCCIFNGEDGLQIGDTIEEIDGEKVLVAGFENNAYLTDIGDLLPLGDVLEGFGNNGMGFEGATYKNVVATNLHGPILPKNPALCDKILKNALTKKYGDISLEPLNDNFEIIASKNIISRITGEQK